MAGEIIKNITPLSDILCLCENCRKKIVCDLITLPNNVYGLLININRVRLLFLMFHPSIKLGQIFKLKDKLKRP